MELTSPWAADLLAEDRATLDSGVSDDLPRRADVVVVGGGILGTATAAACAEAGVGSVLLLERGTLGSGTSHGAAGLLVPEAHAGTDPAVLVELGRSGLRRWRRLEAQVPGGVGLREMDWIALAPHPPGLLGALDPGFERLTEDRVARLAPGLAHPARGIRVRQARVNPLVAVARLAAWHRRQVSVATGVEVVSVASTGGRVRSVGTTAGSISAGAVVLATGEPSRLPGLDFELPTGRVKGHLLLTGPSEGVGPSGGLGTGAVLGTGLPGSIGAIATDIGQGRLLAGGTLDADDQSPDVRAEVIAAIRADLVSALPAMADVPLSHAWCCFRPVHPDRLPVVDRVPGLENAWLTSGHFRTGILVAPATGDALAAWITNGRPPPGVAEFGVARLDPGEGAPGSRGPVG
jgi:glycine oxidase